jgi:hypothetical protein
MAHKYKIGEIVLLRPSLAQNIPGGTYIVIKRIPEYHGKFAYQVRNSYEPHERVVGENELIKAS